MQTSCSALPGQSHALVTGLTHPGLVIVGKMLLRPVLDSIFKLFADDMMQFEYWDCRQENDQQICLQRVHLCHVVLMKFSF